MTELLPVEQAESLRQSLLEYLATTFNLAEIDTHRAFAEFLSDPNSGIFRGPYVRLRLPFAPAADGWQESLDILPELTPYGHQARAFERLSTRLHERPQPTIVTTGTGSGKTEAFTIPILDHVARANARGVKGIKALILYPMNALANDQAARLAHTITTTPAYASVTAALYTGEASGSERTRVTEAGLITDRSAIRDTPPDILLTNYKMLDQLLLRQADANLWSSSATSLTYLVIDEFHSYDGAQGTDVAMLLRRLGATLKAHWSSDDPQLSAEDWARPLGKITPVATSATLGDEGDPAAILHFAQTVTGLELPPDAVITETRIGAEDWNTQAKEAVAARGLSPIEPDRQLISDVTNEIGSLGGAQATEIETPGPPSIADAPDEASRLLFENLYTYKDSDTPRPDFSELSREEMLELAKAHPFITELVERTKNATDLMSLAKTLFPNQRQRHDRKNSPSAFLTVVLSVLSHLRATCGRSAISVDTHLWIRELSRIDRTLPVASHTFRWADDGTVAATGEADADLAYAAVYCRHCGRSGWGVLLAQTGTDLNTNETNARAAHAGGSDYFRALLHAPAEAASKARPTIEALRWFDPAAQKITITEPDPAGIESGTAVPVLVHTGEDAGKKSKEDVCPSCEEPDAIRFLGSAIATQLSVALGSLFGTENLDNNEKKALVFTDSVQDASHRAGFVGSRSHALTLRSTMRDEIDNQPLPLDLLVRRLLDAAGTDARKRYRLLSPELAERERFAPFWREPTRNRPTILARVERRLSLDVILEFGLRANVGRTLEATTSVSVGVLTPDPPLIAAAKKALASANAEQLTPPSDAELVRWVRAILVHMRQRGAIDHRWFNKFRDNDGSRWFLTGGRAREDGMPWFGKGTSAPKFPSISGTSSSEFEPITSRRGWYAGWAAKCLGTGTDIGAHLSKALMAELANRDIIGQRSSASGSTTYHLDPATITVQIADPSQAWEGRLALACNTCGAITRGVTALIDALRDGPCLTHRCPGRLEPVSQRDNYYRRLYSATDPTRLVAREHTSMLDTEERLAYETQFKSDHRTPDAPNVLVATPTLEMGIDIGDLSAVMLASLPPTVANYVQRVGRAGRLTGNSLAVAFVRARGADLPAFTHPERTINGSVKPPATFLDAEEILRRQYFAFAADTLARSGNHQPRTAKDVLATTNAGSYLADAIAVAEEPATLTSFLATFSGLSEETTARLQAWCAPSDGPATSELARRCHQASHEWSTTIESLGYRASEIDQALTELRERAESPAATSEDKEAFRTAWAAVKQTRHLAGELRTRPWIAALEAAGLLPNYTLIDDSVSLDVSLSWFDPESSDYKEEPFTLERGSERALRDFAPGATFYSRGYAIEVDAIDFSRSREAIRTMAACAHCGFMHDLATGPAPARCPRCDKPEIADAAQRFETIELTHVSSIMRRERATIDDRNDDRKRSSFTIATMADIDPARARSWFVEGQDFGVRFQREATLRWVNLGSSRTKGSDRVLGGMSASAPLFRICPACGKQDGASGRNARGDHRPWCPQRKATTEPTRTVALTRTMTTEALSLRLPIGAITADTFALPSLSAALMLGLEKRLGGAPAHLGITNVADPTATGGTNPPALLLYDRVPGGTGYLAELAQPEAMWALLHGAWQAVKECPCQFEETPRLACENCLLPHAAPRAIPHTSRTAAERILATMLTATGTDGEEVPEECPWQTTTVEPQAPDMESMLEKQVRVALRERLETLGATIREQPTSSGEIWRITTANGMPWRLEPQVNVLGSKPDFMLTSSDPALPQVAIFADGWMYHASASHNRIADDAAKRAELREAGYYVLSLTAQDVAGDALRPTWFSPDVRNELISELSLSPAALDRITQPGLDLLVSWIHDPDMLQRQKVAAALPMMLLDAAQVVCDAPANTDLADQARRSLEAGAPRLEVDKSAGDQPDFYTGTFLDGTLAVVTQVQDNAGEKCRVALVLDDTNPDLDSRTAWRAWLQLSNLLALRGDETTITATSLLGQDGGAARTVASPATPLPAGSDHRWGAEAEIPASWQPVVAEATEEELVLIHELLELSKTIAAPEVGEELAGGIPATFSWPIEKVAVVDGETTAEERAELEAEGWHVEGWHAGRILEALNAAGNRD